MNHAFDGSEFWKMGDSLKCLEILMSQRKGEEQFRFDAFSVRLDGPKKDPPCAIFIT